MFDDVHHVHVLGPQCLANHVLWLLFDVPGGSQTGPQHQPFEVL